MSPSTEGEVTNDAASGSRVLRTELSRVSRPRQQLDARPNGPGCVNSTRRAVLAVVPGIDDRSSLGLVGMER